MAFDINKWSRVGISSNTPFTMNITETSNFEDNNGAPTIFSYTAPLTDYLANVLTPGYFSEVCIELKIGDVIFVVARDGNQTLTVDFVNYNGNNKNVVVDVLSTSGLYQRTSYITPAQVANLYNVPFLLVPSAGENYYLNCINAVMSLVYPAGVLPVAYQNVTNVNTINVTCGATNETGFVDAIGFLDVVAPGTSLQTSGIFTGNGLVPSALLSGNGLFLNAQDQFPGGNGVMVVNTIYTKIAITQP